jgi:nucleotidyltransferase substrate binding protein (TIGR01987 family)
MPLDVRWKQRFDNFHRALALLHEPFERDVATLSALEREGTIQRFEFALELAWKTMKDWLESEGRVLQPATPRLAVKEAFAAGLVADGQVWIDMLDHRNLLSHTYDAATFESRTPDVVIKSARFFSTIESDICQ